MFKKNDIALRYFNPFYLDNALLVQFIFSELLIVINKSTEIQLIRNKILPFFPASQEHLPILIERMNDLISIDDHTLLNTKPLLKLKTYIEYYAINLKYQEKLALSLSHDIQLVCHAFNHIRELLNQFKEPLSPHHHVNAFLRSINRLFNQYFKRLDKIIHSAPNLLKSYETNENLILFIFKNEKELSKIYGLNFLSKWFKIHSKNIQLLLELLKEKYLEKGYEHLIPLINRCECHADEKSI